MEALIVEKLIFSRLANLALDQSYGQAPAAKRVAVPTVSENEIQVQVRSVALNPIDVKYADSISPCGSRLGCDFAGVVTVTGSNVGAKWKVGDRVAGMVFGGMTSAEGAFAEHLTTDKDSVWAVPTGCSDDDASTFGIPAVTAMLALNVYFDLPWPDHQPQETEQGKGSSSDKTILIYSAASAVGIFAIQLAKLAGWTTVCTASPHSFDLVKSYGADHVFDYRSATAATEIRTQFPNITKALDCFSDHGSTQFCAQVLQESGGKILTLLPTKSKTKNVQAEMIMSFTVFGKGFQWLPPIGPKYGISSANREAFIRFYEMLGRLVESAKLKAPTVSVTTGQVGSIALALDQLRQGSVSGRKLVVSLEPKS